MKILQTVFDIMDYGGIVNHVELLAKGFGKLGHHQEMVILRNSDRPPRVTKMETHIAGTYKSYVANQVNTISGWYGALQMSYGSKQRLNEWKKFASKFDLIIHQLPVPKPDAAGWWRKVYDVDVPQVAIAHDAHFRDMYPHMIEIADKLTAVSVTNPAGYTALEWLPAPRCFIGAPHVIRKWDSQKPWKERSPRFVSAHVWKAWKHMDKVVRAIPHLDADIVANLIGGDGIEGRYMRSKDKCKDKYKGIWKAALKSGMNYVGLIEPRALMREYEASRVMVDLSWSKKFEDLGNHFNRSTIEAYNGGCVPLVTRENMYDETGIFKEGEHYVHVGAHASIDEVADKIERTVHMNPKKAREIIENGRELLLKNFHYLGSAAEFIKLGEGKKHVGIYKKLEVGKATKEVKRRSRELLHSVESAS